MAVLLLFRGEPVLLFEAEDWLLLLEVVGGGIFVVVVEIFLFLFLLKFE